MASWCTALLNLLYIVNICNSQWDVIYDPPLPRGDWAMACAFYNDSIFILGGYLHRKQVVEYRLSDNVMIDHGSTAIPNFFSSQYGGDFWYQFNNKLYLKQHRGSDPSTVIVYDITKKEFWKDPPLSITAPTNVDRTCTTGNDEYLIISGGFPSTKKVHVLILSKSLWISGAPMQNYNDNAACCIVSGFLYMIGGGGGSTIEKIHINDLIAWTVLPWTVLQDTFNTGISKSSVVPYFNFIWVLGSDKNDGNRPDGKSIYVINTMNDSVVLYGQLPYDVHFAAALIVDDTGMLYMFGGRRNVSSPVVYSSWIKHQLPTSSPTDLPTSSPSKATVAPTKMPSNDPSTNPTEVPSDVPTKSPFIMLHIRPSSSTKPPSESPVSSPFVTTADDEGIDQTMATKNEGDVAIPLIIAASSFCTCVGLAICYFFYTFCSKERKKMEDNLAAMEGKKNKGETSEISGNSLELTVPRQPIAAKTQPKAIEEASHSSVEAYVLETPDNVSTKQADDERLDPYEDMYDSEAGKEIATTTAGTITME